MHLWIHKEGLKTVIELNPHTLFAIAEGLSSSAITIIEIKQNHECYIYDT